MPVALPWALKSLRVSQPPTWHSTQVLFEPFLLNNRLAWGSEFIVDAAHMLDPSRASSTSLARSSQRVRVLHPCEPSSFFRAEYDLYCYSHYFRKKSPKRHRSFKRRLFIDWMSRVLRRYLNPPRLMDHVACWLRSRRHEAFISFQDCWSEKIIERGVFQGTIILPTKWFGDKHIASKNVPQPSLHILSLQRVLWIQFCLCPVAA